MNPLGTRFLEVLPFFLDSMGVKGYSKDDWDLGIVRIDEFDCGIHVGVRTLVVTEKGNHYVLGFQVFKEKNWDDTTSEIVLTYQGNEITQALTALGLIIAKKRALAAVMELLPNPEEKA